MAGIWVLKEGMLSGFEGEKGDEKERQTVSANCFAYSIR